VRRSQKNNKSGIITKPKTVTNNITQAASQPIIVRSHTAQALAAIIRANFIVLNIDYTQNLHKLSPYTKLNFTYRGYA
jgi:hypothetical protein